MVTQNKILDSALQNKYKIRLVAYIQEKSSNETRWGLMGHPALQNKQHLWGIVSKILLL